MKRIAIVGMGKLAKGIEGAVKRFPDLELKYIFSRRNDVKSNFGTKVLPFGAIYDYKGEIDALILTHGSGSDLRKSSYDLAKSFNTVDSFDIHGKIPDHLEAMGRIASENRRTAVVSSGWDPGLLSLMRLYFGAFLPYAEVGTLWGRGVSQGHSEVLRRIEGVRYALQITEPKEEYESLLISGKRFSSVKAHKRICYVVADSGKEEEIANRIKAIDGYFSGYDTEINFIDESDFSKMEGALYHKGRVCAAGTADGRLSVADFSVKMDSNPDFTAHILLATARAAIRLNEEKSFGAYTLFDIPPRLFCHMSPLILI